MLLTCPEDPFKFRMARVQVQEIHHNSQIANYSSYGINSFIRTRYQEHFQPTF